MQAPSRDPDHYDVVVIGGAIAGASTALLLERWHPSARVLVVERSTEFDRKVGEATVEISALFLTRVLGLYDHLVRNHLPKHGLRYWFSNGPGRPLEAMSEVGLGTIPQLPSFQLDRSVLDQHVLDLAVDAGAELLRPAKVRDAELGGRESRVTIETDGALRTVTARWVVDASGKRAWLAKRLGLWQRNDRHPTSAVWGRFRGVEDLDGKGLLGADALEPSLPYLRCARRLATNHFCTRGSWTWTIPHGSGLTSVGTVYDRRLFDLPPGDSMRERFESFVRSSSGLGELLEGAELDEGDFRHYEHLSYNTRQYMDDGWAIVGDAAAFIDPYYSPGLDHVSFSVYATARILEEQLAGKLDERSLARAITRHNREFDQSFHRYFQALYEDKYEIMGDAELSAASYLMDTSLYFMGVVGPAYRDLEELRRPVLGQDVIGARLARWLLTTYNRRLARLARKRVANGTYGRRNEGWRCIGSDFGVGEKRLSLPFLSGLKLWLGAEWSAFRDRNGPPTGREETSVAGGVALSREQA